MRQQPVADGEGVACDTAPCAVGPGQGDRLDAVHAVGGDDRVPPAHADPVPGQAGGVHGALHGLAEGYGAGVPQQVARVGGLGERRDARPGRREARRDRQQQRPRPGDDDRTAGEHQTALEHRLRATRRDDPGQRPAGERQHLLVSPGRQDHPVRADRARLERVQGEPRFHAPDLAPREVGDAARLDVGLKAPAQPPPGTPRVVQGPGPACPQARCGLPVELPARLGRGVHQRDAHAGVRGLQRGRDPRRAGTQDGQLVPHPAHVRLPRRLPGPGPAPAPVTAALLCRPAG